MLDDLVALVEDRALEGDEPAVGLVEVFLGSVTLARSRIVSPIFTGALNFQRSPPNASVAYGAVARLKSPDWIARHRRPWAMRSPKIDFFMNSASVCSTL